MGRKQVNLVKIRKNSKKLKTKFTDAKIYQFCWIFTIVYDFYPNFAIFFFLKFIKNVLQ